MEKANRAVGKNCVDAAGHVALEDALDPGSGVDLPVVRFGPDDRVVIGGVDHQDGVRGAVGNISRNLTRSVPAENGPLAPGREVASLAGGATAGSQRAREDNVGDRHPGNQRAIVRAIPTLVQVKLP